jgi:hypothetical protein
MTWLSGGKRVARGHAPVAKGWSSPVNEAPKTLAIWVPVKLVVRALKILVRIRVKVVVIIVLLGVLLGSLRHRRRCRLHEHAEHGRSWTSSRSRRQKASARTKMDIVHARISHEETSIFSSYRLRRL